MEDVDVIDTQIQVEPRAFVKGVSFFLKFWFILFVYQKEVDPEPIHIRGDVVGLIHFNVEP